MTTDDGTIIANYVEALAASLERIKALEAALTGLLLSYEGYVKAKDDYGRDWEALPAVATASGALPPPPAAEGGPPDADR